MAYFKCDPSICGGAKCCRDQNSYPNLSLGDYFRLSELTGEPAAQIWLTKGMITLSQAYPGQPVLIAYPSLRHDPCPYLAQSKCLVHDSKPICCLSFPVHSSLYEKKGALNQQIYSCLNGGALSERQKRFAQGLEQIILTEVELEKRFLWQNEPILVAIRGVKDYFNLAAKALDIQTQKDPHQNHQMTRELISTVENMMTLVDSTKDEFAIHINDLIAALRPVMYVLAYDRIRNRLLTSGSEIRSAYAQTTEMLKNLCSTD